MTSPDRGVNELMTDDDGSFAGENESQLRVDQHTFETEQLKKSNLTLRRILTTTLGAIKTAQACLTPTGRLRIMFTTVDSDDPNRSYAVHCRIHGDAVSSRWIEAVGPITLEGEGLSCLIFLEDLEGC